MSEQTPKPKREYEGPARLVSDEHNARMLREKGRGIPQSYAEHLTQMYGPEGVGWGFETDTNHAQENELSDVAHGVEFALANEALHNFLGGEGYKLDDGQDMRGKVQSRPRPPHKGNIVVYPDGDIYHQDQQNK